MALVLGARIHSHHQATLHLSKAIQSNGLLQGLHFPPSRDRMLLVSVCDHVSASGDFCSGDDF